MQILWEFFFSHVALSSARAWFDFPGWYYLSQSPFWVRLGCNLWADQRVVRKCGAQLPNFSFHHPSYSKLNLAHKSLLISTPILSIRRVCDIFELLLLTMMEMQVCRWQWHIRLIYTFYAHRYASGPIWEIFFIQLLTKAICMQNSRKQFHILPGMEEK